MRHGYAKQSVYPCKIYKIAKLKSNSRIVAITKDDFEKFKRFDVSENPSYETTYKMFLFSYYEGGINFKDLTALRWVNVQDGRLVYKRDKTKGDFNLKLHNEALKILEYFKNHPKSENEKYVFPIIHKHNLTEKQVYGRYKRCLKKFNIQLKYIADTVGNDKNITS